MASGAKHWNHQRLFSTINIAGVFPNQCPIAIIQIHCICFSTKEAY